jgi:hypothetical protein
VRREDFAALDALDALDLPSNVVPHKANGTPTVLPLAGLEIMLNEPEDITRWIVEDRIPASSVCLLVAKPKVGKTTAARHLAVAVARGESWLGCQCEQGIVWYLALEGRKADHLAHFRQFQLDDDEAARIRCYIGPAKPGLLTDMRTRAADERPNLIIVDTLQRLLQVKSMDDYAEVTKAFDPIIACARETGAAILLIHHAGKSVDREALDTVLGSTAIAGSVDNTIVLAKLAGFRTVTTRQRIGPDLDERVIQLSDDGRVVLGGSREQMEQRAMMQKLYDALANANTDLETHDWLDLVEGRKQTKLAAIRQLVTEGTILRAGDGKRQKPYIYTVPSVPVVPAVPNGSHAVPEPVQDDIFEL